MFSWFVQILVFPRSIWKMGKLKGLPYIPYFVSGISAVKTSLRKSGGFPQKVTVSYSDWYVKKAGGSTVGPTEKGHFQYLSRSLAVLFPGRPGRWIQKGSEFNRQPGIRNCPETDGFLLQISRFFLGVRWVWIFRTNEWITSICTLLRHQVFDSTVDIPTGWIIDVALNASS